MNENKEIVRVTVHDASEDYAPIAGAVVRLLYPDSGTVAAAKRRHTATATVAQTDLVEPKITNKDGVAEFKVDSGSDYQVKAQAFGLSTTESRKEGQGSVSSYDLAIPVGFTLNIVVYYPDGSTAPYSDVAIAGRPIKVKAELTSKQRAGIISPKYSFSSNRGVFTKTGDDEGILDTTASQGPVTFSATASQANDLITDLPSASSSITISRDLQIAPSPPQAINGDVRVTLGRSGTTLTPDMALWTYIRMATGAISFANYKKFMDDVLCGRKQGEQVETRTRRHRHLGLALPFPGVEPYTLVKRATEVFLMTHCGVKGDNGFGFYNLDLDKTALLDEQNRYGRNIDGSALNELWQTQYLVDYANGGNPSQPHKTLPYLALIRSRLGEVPIKDDDGFTSSSEVANCFGILRSKLENPCLLELIWSYWHEEGMLVQTMKAISLRFQNRTSGERDPLTRFDIDPLRPLGNLLWGYIQDEQHRLSVMRRNLEYRHHYDMPLQGRAAPVVRAADVRSKFLEAFHNLLHTCAIFFKADDDTTKIADGFPVMNAIREVHLLLAEGAHNQFGDLPSTARQEMLMEQWILARPEMREFLGGRIMVPYSEVWMDRVDTVKRLEGWTDNTITDFHDLAVFGEQLLLSIRYGHWSDVHDPAHAANWARYWRPEIQGYLHSYRSVTGVDLNVEVTDTRVHDRYAPPSTHLQRRLELQRAQRPSDGGAPGLPKRQRNGGSGDVRVAVTRPAGTRAEMEVSEDF
jgi:hypothetical protein